MMTSPILTESTESPRLSRFSFEAVTNDDMPTKLGTPALLTIDPSSVEEHARDSGNADITDATDVDTAPLSPVISVKRGNQRKVTIMEPDCDTDGDRAYVEFGDAQLHAKDEGGKDIKSAGKNDSRNLKIATKPERTCFCLPVIPTAISALFLAMAFKILIAATYASLVRPVGKDFDDLKQRDVLAIVLVVVISCSFAIIYLAGMVAVFKRLLMPVKVVIILLAIDTVLTPLAYILRILPINKVIAEEVKDGDGGSYEVMVLQTKITISYLLLFGSLVIHAFFIYVLGRYLRVVGKAAASKPAVENSPDNKTESIPTTPSSTMLPFAKILNVFAKK